MPKDWTAWHRVYDEPDSALAGRLRAVSAEIDRYLDATGPDPVSIISACAGDGRDLLMVLERRTDASRVTACLVELDPELAARARAVAGPLAAQVEVRQGDAARSDTYLGATPADLLLLCGIFGNVSDSDIHVMVEAAPQLCAPHAEVIWTRDRKHLDLTSSIRGWFADAGFEELAFVAPAETRWSVGVQRLIVQPRPLQPGQRWFSFRR